MHVTAMPLASALLSAKPLFPERAPPKINSFIGPR
jgi:hypothetical protein